MRRGIGQMARTGILAAAAALAAGGAPAAPGTEAAMARAGLPATAAALTSGAAPGTATAPEPTPSERIGILMAQVLGTTCETPDAECTTDEAPVGSICQCGDTPGTIVAE